MADAKMGKANRAAVLCLFVLICLVLPQTGYSLYIEGDLETREEWAFLGRFCFLSERGKLKFEFEYPQKDYEPQNILLYFDSADQWPAVYKSDKTCEQKESVLVPGNNQIIELIPRGSYSGCVNISGHYVCRGGRGFRSVRERWWFIAASHCNSVRNCWQKEAAVHPENNQIIYLSIFFSGSGCKVFNVTGTPTYHCSGGRQFASSRERWWYLAASKCGSSKGLKLKYKLTMTNADEGDIFFRHFSADEFYILQLDIGFLCLTSAAAAISITVAYILQVDIAFLILFFVMFIISIVCGVMLRNRQLFHTTYKLYMTSLLCEVFYLFIMCIAYGKYANDGREDRGLKTFGRIFESASTLTFLLLLILMGKGYTITRGRLSACGSIKIAVFMTIYVITYAVLFIYEANFFDPGEVLYVYESPPGYGLIGLRLLGWIWFCYAIFFTLKHFPEKAAFYYPFFIFYTIWFLITPIFILIAHFAITKWVREKVINGVSLTITICAHTFFLFLTRPTAANKNFPYHVRTSQIGIMSPTQAAANGGIPMSASNESESFTRYAYAPSTPADPPPPYGLATANFSELFTVSNTHTSKDAQIEYDYGHGPRLVTDPQTANVDRFPRQRPGDNPFVVTNK